MDKKTFERIVSITHQELCEDKTLQRVTKGNEINWDSIQSYVLNTYGLRNKFAEGLLKEKKYYLSIGKPSWAYISEKSIIMPDVYGVIIEHSRPYAHSYYYFPISGKEKHQKVHPSDVVDKNIEVSYVYYSHGRAKATQSVNDEKGYVYVGTWQ